MRKQQLQKSLQFPLPIRSVPVHNARPADRDGLEGLN
jgi:hypothetical protein